MHERIQQLYETYGPIVHRRSLFILKNEEKACDVTQDVFLRLLEDVSIIDRMKSPVSFLYRMATNVSLNALKKDRRLARGIDIRMEAFPDLKTEIISPESILRTLTSNLPEKTKTIVFCRYVDGMTLKEIADFMGMSLSGIRKRLDAFRRHARAQKESIE